MKLQIKEFVYWTHKKRKYSLGKWEIISEFRRPLTGFSLANNSWNRSTLKDDLSGQMWNWSSSNLTLDTELFRRPLTGSVLPGRFCPNSQLWFQKITKIPTILGPKSRKNHQIFNKNCLQRPLLLHFYVIIFSENSEVLKNCKFFGKNFLCNTSFLFVKNFQKLMLKTCGKMLKYPQFLPKMAWISPNFSQWQKSPINH